MVRFIPSFLFSVNTKDLFRTISGISLSSFRISIISCSWDWSRLRIILHTSETDFINVTDWELHHCSIQSSYKINKVILNYNCDQFQIIIFKKSLMALSSSSRHLVFGRDELSIFIPMETTGHSGQPVSFANPFKAFCPCSCKRRSPLNSQWFTSQWSNLHSTTGVTEVVNGSCYFAPLVIRSDEVCWKNA